MPSKCFSEAGPSGSWSFSTPRLSSGTWVAKIPNCFRCCPPRPRWRPGGNRPSSRTLRWSAWIPRSRLRPKPREGLKSCSRRWRNLTPLPRRVCPKRRPELEGGWQSQTPRKLPSRRRRFSRPSNRRRPVSYLQPLLLLRHRRRLLSKRSCRPSPRKIWRLGTWPRGSWSCRRRPGPPRQPRRLKCTRRL